MKNQNYQNPAQEEAKRQMPSVGRILQIVIVVLLCANLSVTVFSMLKPQSRYQTPEEKAYENQQFEIYEKAIGKDVSVTGVQEEKSEYGGANKLKGTAINNSKKSLSGAKIEYDFYLGNAYVGSGSTYVDKILPNSNVSFELYAPETSYDNYKLQPVKADYLN